MARDVLKHRARIPSSQIGYVNAVVESMEGACMLRTIDPARGLVEFWVSPDFTDDFQRLVEGLRKEFPLEVDPPQEPSLS